MSLLTGDDLLLRAVSVSKEQLVFVKHHLEASEGLGFLVADRGGDAFLVAHESQREALELFIEDLKHELGLRTVVRPSHAETLDRHGASSDGIE